MEYCGSYISFDIAHDGSDCQAFKWNLKSFIRLFYIGRVSSIPAQWNLVGFTEHQIRVSNADYERHEEKRLTVYGFLATCI